MNRTLYCFLFTVLFSTTLLAQKAKLPNTLLWRISGNGLAKPSYLFGTMHVKDRRVFQFSDSLYHFLETVDGYAMEIDPDETMTALFKTLTAPDTTAFLKDKMPKGDFKKIARELEAKFGTPADRITKRQAWLYKQGWKSSARAKPDDMDAAVDLYLYNIAKNSGKWVGGIEDLEDQLNLIEEMGALDANDLLGSANKGSVGIETLLKIYIAQDLNKIQEGIDEMSAGARDSLLLRRNHKMARRMDSLMQVRTHFFAVGAAHLPGGEGVLQLLKERGFTIEAVFSKKKIAPQNYTYTKTERTWHTITNDEKSYVVSMPGDAVEISPDGTTKMRLYADLGTGLIYFSTSIPLAPGIKQDSMLQVMAKRIANKNNTPEKIVYNGIQGFETLKDSGNYFYRVRLLPDSSHVVMTMVGSEKKSLLYSEEAQRFYRSLKVMPPIILPLKQPGDWYTYRNERMALQLAFPDTPQINPMMQQNLEQREGASSWHFINQTYLDAGHNNYYMLIVKETGPGYYIISDDLLFEEAKKNAKANKDLTVSKYDTGRWNGLPAMWMQGFYNQAKLAFKSFTVNRDNRAYAMVAMYDPATDSAQILHFFNSLQLLPYTPSPWQTYTDPTNNFTTSAPAPLLTIAHDSTLKTRTTASYDPHSAFSFQVAMEPLPPYIWTANDSTYFANTIAGYVSPGDSMLYARNCTNGAAHGREYVIRMEGGRNVKRLRLLLNGDSTYLLYTITPESHLLRKDEDTFFNDFRFTTYRPTKTIYQNNAGKLIAALQTGDSAAFQQAKDYIDAAPFTLADVPQVHQAMLTPLRDLGDGTYSALHKLIDKAVALSDTATITFIETHFATLTGEKAALQYPFLKALAGIHKDTAYAVLKKLVLQHTPTAGSSKGLSYLLRDSLQLTKTLFPEILRLATDSLFCSELTDITTIMLDSNLLKVEDVVPYQKAFIAQAKKKWRFIENSDDDVWNLYYDIQLLGKFNNAESNTLLQQIAQHTSIELKQQAVMQLLTNKQPVTASQLQKIAADRYYRTTLYEGLKKLDRLSLFPAAYLNQKSFAEGYMYEYASDDEEPSRMDYIGKREAEYMGKRKIFYLFKIDYGYEDGIYLGVVGPYEAGSKTTADYPDVVGMSDDVFNAGTIDTQLRDYLKQQEANTTEPE